ncbi:MAG TPA: NADH-quinone oxidoreductase subunit K [Kineosporiaceae bacterium]
MIHLAGPVVLAAALAGAGVYGLLARRNAVLVLIGAELLLNAVNVLLVTASALPAGGLAGLAAGGTRPAADPLMPGQVLAIVVITIAAAEIGLALAVVLLVYRRRSSVDLTQLRELGEASPTYQENPDDGELTARATSPGPGSTGALPSVVEVAAREQEGASQ